MGKGRATMKAIFSLAVVVILSSPALSQNYINQPSNYSEAVVGGTNAVGQDNLSFAKAVRRKVRQRQPVCTSGTCLWWQTCCPRYNSDGKEIGHVCKENIGPFPAHCSPPPF